MPLPQSLRSPVAGVLLALALSPMIALAAYVPQGGEYPLLSDPRGDQVRPVLALAPPGGWSYVAWEDNATDGSGLGISTRLLDGSLQGAYPQFRMNWTTAGNQEHPVLAMLADRTSAFVYQNEVAGARRIQAVMLTPFVTLGSGEITVNTFTGGSQSEPAAAGLSDGNLLVVWTSTQQEGLTNYTGIYGQILSSEGDKLGSEFHVNQCLPGVQRSPAVAALPGGRFVVAWTSTEQSGPLGVDVFARVFNANATPAGAEFRVSTSTNACANPRIAATTDGRFTIVWQQVTAAGQSSGVDLCARAFTAAALPAGPAWQVNVATPGNQFGPRIASSGSDYLIVWNGSGANSSPQGIFGRFVDGNGAPAGSEFRINTTSAGQQLTPDVASDGDGQFIVVWSAFVGAPNSFDLFAQRYSNADSSLPAPAAPFVSTLDASRLLVSWLPVAGQEVSRFEIFVDGATTAAGVSTSNFWTFTGGTPASQHAFKTAYVLADGRRSVLSAATLGTTSGTDANGDALPDDWQVRYWGSAAAAVARAKFDADGDGVNNYDEFLAGTDPTNPASVFKVSVRRAGANFEVKWISVKGLVYQLQRSASLASPAWQDVGEPVVAGGESAAASLGGTGTGFYRVMRVR